MPANNEASPRLQVPYKAYLIRLWWEGEVDGWRASAQSVQSGEVARFASLEALFAFLESRTADQTHNQDI